MKNVIKLFASILLIFIAFISNAQQNDTLEIQRNDKGIVNFARFRPRPDRKIQDGTKFLKTILVAKLYDEFQLIKETTDELGISHCRFQQYYKGIKVENAEYLVHGKNGIIETINGNFEHVNISSIIPSINEQQALNKALGYVNAQKYKWEDEECEKFIKQRLNNPDATYYPIGELVICKDYLKGGENLKLSWKFSISSLIPNDEQLIYVDAVIGEVIRIIPMILETNIAGNAETIYSGTLGITCDSYSSSYRLNESRNTTPGNSVNIHTWNCLSGSNYANAVEFSNNNTNWITGSWPNITQNQAALDAHWGEEMVLDYWRTVHSKNSLNNQGISIIGYVHYYDSSNPNNWPNNAQWDGTNHVMRFGDGDGINFHPLTALDVVAHEMGHGITQFTANLTPGNQESGALNEGFSDIWGACVEHWAAPNKQTWLMGEEIFVTAAFDCIRNLQNPNSITASEGQHPDTYHGDFWDFNGEPHNNSTVLSHWFYILSQGGNNTNDNDDCFNVAAIGINDAQLIAYRTESMLNSSATYADARNMSIQAATYLFGTNSNQVAQTTNAWFAVGVGDEYQYQISGPPIVCSSGATFSINNLPTEDTIIWNQSYNLLTRVSPQGSNPCTFTANNSNNEGIIGAQIIGCGGTVTLPDMQVRTGINNGDFSFEVWNSNGQLVDTQYGLDILCPNRTYYIYVINNGDCETTNYTWQIPSWWTQLDASENWIKIITNSDPSGAVSANAITCCGDQTQLITGDFWQASYCYNLSFTPNPATDETTLELLDASGIQADMAWDVEVYDQLQILKLKTDKAKKSNFKINTSSWKDGVYIVRVNIGKEIISGKLVVKH